MLLIYSYFLIILFCEVDRHSLQSLLRSGHAGIATFMLAMPVHFLKEDIFNDFLLKNNNFFSEIYHYHIFTLSYHGNGTTEQQINDRHFYSSKSIKLLSMKKSVSMLGHRNFDSYIECILGSVVCNFFIGFPRD